MKISIQTLGCKVNQSESASFEGILRNSDYEIVKHTDNPDICIVNTCTVTAKSDYQSRQIIRKAIKSGAKVIAAGCYAQIKPDELSEIEGLNLVIGNSGKNDILKYVREISGDSSTNTDVDVKEPDFLLHSQPYHSNRSRAFLKIQDGCNFSCSYCAVPSARGRSRSLNVPGVLQSVEKLASDGYKEIVLTGIHIGSYGQDLDPKSALIDLVRSICDQCPDVRIRLSSMEPQELNEGFLDLMKDGRVCPHLHIPLQSGTDRILKVMNRGYSTKYYTQVINRIITAYPDISIGTDIITGFPGETVNDFNTTVKFLEELPLTYLHVFPYSQRPDTNAALLNDQISEKDKKHRVKRLLEISRTKKYDYISRHLGSELNVIVENKIDNNGHYIAISDNYLRILVKSSYSISGQSIKVRVISLMDNELIGQPV